MAACDVPGGVFLDLTEGSSTPARQRQSLSARWCPDVGPMPRHRLTQCSSRGRPARWRPWGPAQAADGFSARKDKAHATISQGCLTGVACCRAGGRGPLRPTRQGPVVHRHHERGRRSSWGMTPRLFIFMGERVQGGVREEGREQRNGRPRRLRPDRLCIDTLDRLR